MKLINLKTNESLLEDVRMATSFWDRCKGLLGTSEIQKNHGLWINPCRSIHTFFMKYPIDVIFFDKKLRVTRVVENAVPWRLVILQTLHTRSCIEMKSGHLGGRVKPGDKFELRD